MKKSRVIVLSAICAALAVLCIVFIIKNVGLKRAIGKGLPDETVWQITPEDADELVEEKLENTGFEYKRLTWESISGNKVYVYDILDGEKSLGEMLAVDAVSGTVYAYADGELSPYSDFSGYDAGMDESIEWTGTYVRKTGDDGSVTLTLEETEPGSFMYRFINADGSESEPGFGFYEDRVNGMSEYGEYSLSFVKEGDSVTVSCDQSFEYAGIYALGE